MGRDSKAIIPTDGLGSTALALEPELAETVRRVIAAAESANTRRAYVTLVSKFEAWCQRRHTSALRATPAIVAIYLTDLAATGADPGRPMRREPRSRPSAWRYRLSPRLTAPSA